jgi:hypothetical protein
MDFYYQLLQAATIFTAENSLLFGRIDQTICFREKIIRQITHNHPADLLSIAVSQQQRPSLKINGIKF